jgi:hypothetical protein
MTDAVQPEPSAATPATAAQPSPDGPAPGSPPARPRNPFGLRWGIKSSFVAYVMRMPDGQGSMSDGASPTDTNELMFEPDPAIESPDAGADRFWAFRGDIRFKGHYGMLFVRVAHPWITLRGDQAELTVDDPYQREGGERLHLVSFDLAPGTPPSPELEIWSGTNVRMESGGVELFNDVYQAGEPFEPLTIILPAAAASAG